MTATIVQSSQPSSAVTVQVDGTPLDGGHDSFHDALFRGAFSPLEDIDDHSRRIVLDPPVRVNYGSHHDLDQRKVNFMHFATIPPPSPPGHDDQHQQGQQERHQLQVRFDLTVQRLFQFQEYPGTLQRHDVRPGNKFRLRISRLDRPVPWWTFGDLQGDLKEKKFVGAWTSPNEDGRYDDFEGVVDDGQKPDRDDLIRHGWVFSEPVEDLRLFTDHQKEDDGDDGVIIEFVE